ncbi:Uncharacterized protein dnm_065955 [Desulfonema magnum]|uniref:Uncharacterized protein n=1 Tax=Desulfonema magnum TaxID=45655 RepID=A0A975BT08_9BACT|nr:Uncharacterized protein dnm_065955 [Desulfonema magnum]
MRGCFSQKNILTQCTLIMPQRHKVSRRFSCLRAFVTFAVCPCSLRLKKVACGWKCLFL